MYSSRTSGSSVETASLGVRGNCGDQQKGALVVWVVRRPWRWRDKEMFQLLDEHCEPRGRRILRNNLENWGLATPLQVQTTLEKPLLWIEKQPAGRRGSSWRRSAGTSSAPRPRPSALPVQRPDRQRGTRRGGHRPRSPRWKRRTLSERTLSA